MNKPNVIYHADWGSNHKKRWSAKAILRPDGHYTAYAPALVGDCKVLLAKLQSEVGKTGCVLAGFDFPIGIPIHYAKRANISKFRDFLLLLGKDKWVDFHSVCDRADQISAHRPFYPNGDYKGRERKDLLDAHEAGAMEALLRTCERGGKGQKQACSLFWTLGGNQVGKAALDGWHHVLIPALREEGLVCFWPFDGSLASLLNPGHTVIAETYPAECYGWFPGEPPRSKGNIECRKKFGISLHEWAQASQISIDPALKIALDEGFQDGKDDAFDAVVGLFGMLQICLGQRQSAEPEDEPIREVEGWIMGRRPLAL